MKNLILLILLIASVVLIFLSQKTFYKGQVETVYEYDGSVCIGGERFDEDGKLLEKFYFHDYVEDGKIKHEVVGLTYYTFWGKYRDVIFYVAILTTVILIIALYSSNKDKLQGLFKKE